MIALFALLLFAAPEAAPAANPAVAPKPASAKADKICVTKTEPGSRFKSKVCFDKAEYELRQAEERKALDRMQRVPARSN